MKAPTLNEVQVDAAAGGRLYGDVMLSVLAIVLLLVGVPWFAGAAVGMAYNSNAVEVEARPLTNATGSSPGWAQHVSHTDNPSTVWTGAGMRDCQPYFLGVPDFFPPYGYGGPNNYNGGYLFTSQAISNEWRWLRLTPNPSGNNPFNTTYPGASPHSDCSTENDEIGIRYDSTQIRTGTGHALLRFNQTLVRWDYSLPTSANDSWRATFDWHVELNGTRMFGESVACDDYDGRVRTDNWGTNAAALYPVTLHLDHTLNTVEERRWRDAVALIDSPTGHANMSTLNMTVFITPKVGGSFDCPGYAVQWQDATGSYTAYDWYARTELDYAAADDYDLIIRGAALILGVLLSVVAVASTPFWNPLANRLRGG